MGRQRKKEREPVLAAIAEVFDERGNPAHGCYHMSLGRMFRSFALATSAAPFISALPFTLSHACTTRRSASAHSGVSSARSESRTAHPGCCNVGGPLPRRRASCS